MTFGQHIQSIIDGIDKPFLYLSDIKYELIRNKIPHKMVNFRTKAEAFEPFEVNEKVIFIPNRPIRFQSITNICIACYDLSKINVT